jgi:hypothetical protein
LPREAPRAGACSFRVGAGNFRAMKTSLLALFTCVLLTGGVAAEEILPPLFNGTNLAGWKAVNGGHYAVTNGLLALSGGTGWLRTEREFGDFVLAVELRPLVEKYNSGIFVRAALAGAPFPTNVWQVNLKDTALGDLLRGSVTVVPSQSPALPVGQWIKLRLECRGRKLTLDLDGRRQWEFDQLEPARGYVGLQAEGKAFEFRSVTLRELDAATGPER